MKKTIALLSVFILSALVFTGCSQKDMNNMKEDVSSVVSDAKDNLNNMIEDGTVNDGDGHIDEDKHDDATAPVNDQRDMTENATENIVNGQGQADDDRSMLDSSNGSEATQADEFI